MKKRLENRIGEKRKLTTSVANPNGKRYETFEEYAANLGVFYTKMERKEIKLTRNKGKVTTHGVNRVRVAKEGPKPKRMLRIEGVDGLSLGLYL